MVGSVLISGAGIAGSVPASLLGRQKAAVTVVEVAHGARSGGQAVDLRGAGRSVLERMGLLEQARPVALDQQGIAHVDTSGRHRFPDPMSASMADGWHSGAVKALERQNAAFAQAGTATP